MKRFVIEDLFDVAEAMYDEITNKKFFENFIHIAAVCIYT